ncbi:ParA family protein [Streptomyces antarcticus]|uniref:ParA family protein n=1 Tax=Streptomyces antarcticus TaxID=2996458 RepID=UPI00226E306B|nr:MULTISPECIES: ParA family protein [unclassified Streptomyces]MCY0947289.1 ParA family protein [Streptomyces sp. H34-AA3]MCZ4086534.1 ParA family protein [Streptomyces sp. H34-S5]
MARRVAMLNNKGGVGKSGTTIRLAEALAKMGKRVIVIDMDPQGNSSQMLGWEYDKDLKQPTISQAIKANTGDDEALGCARSVFQPIGWNCSYAERISIAPSQLPLENRMSEAGIGGAWRRLHQALDGADDHADYTLIDCPPSLLHLTQLALAAAHDAVIVTDADVYAIEGAQRARNLIVKKAATNLGNPDLQLRGVILNKYKDTIRQNEQRDSIRQIFGPLVWDPTVKFIETLATANNNAVSLEEAKGDRLSEIRATYELLTQTFLKEIPLP